MRKHTKSIKDPRGQIPAIGDLTTIPSTINVEREKETRLFGRVRTDRKPRANNGYFGVKLGSRGEGGNSWGFEFPFPP